MEAAMLIWSCFMSNSNETILLIGVEHARE